MVDRLSTGKEVNATMPRRDSKGRFVKTKATKRKTTKRRKK